MAINRGNIGINHYNQGFGNRIPFAGGQAMAGIHGRGQFGQMQARGGHIGGFPNNFGGQHMNQRGHHQMMRPGMNMMPNMQGQQGMNMMPNMQGQPNINMPQSIDGVTFEPLNPSNSVRHQPSGMTAAIPNVPPHSVPGTSIEPKSTSVATAPNTNESSHILSSFIQGEKNAHKFYQGLYELAPDEHARSVINRILNNANKRDKFLGLAHTKMTGSTYLAQDVPIIDSRSFSQGVRDAIEIENNAVSELSDLYEKIDNAMYLKTLNVVIQKKILDIISLQQLAIYR